LYRSKGIASIHGDKTQLERTDILGKFKQGQLNILIATNVASRGLDIPSIKTVINFDCAKDKEDHIHRIGRTGRAGDKEGVAYTLLFKNETAKACMLVKILE
jgi:ATP-dependent RNA helicase DDX42